MGTITVTQILLVDGTAVQSNGDFDSRYRTEANWVNLVCHQHFFWLVVFIYAGMQ